MSLAVEKGKKLLDKIAKAFPAVSGGECSNYSTPLFTWT